MKHRLLFFLLFFAIISVFLPLAEGTEDGHLLSTTALIDPGYKVENLSADIFVGGTILIVKADVRNLRSTPLKGYAIIHLQTANREEIGTVETEVNKNASVLKGNTGQIEITINISQFPKVKNVSIEFVNR